MSATFSLLPSVAHVQGTNRRTAKAAEGAARIARARCDAGVIDSLARLDSERALLLARDCPAQGQTGTAVSLVRVSPALAGGS